MVVVEIEDFEQTEEKINITVALGLDMSQVDLVTGVRVPVEVRVGLVPQDSGETRGEQRIQTAIPLAAGTPGSGPVYRDITREQVSVPIPPDTLGKEAQVGVAVVPEMDKWQSDIVSTETFVVGGGGGLTARQKQALVVLAGAGAFVALR